jgi:EmrB/QacA subfamily drug resistance transporter
MTVINKNYGRYYFLIFTTCLVHLMLGLDINVVSISMPSIAQHFNVTPASASKIVWIYFLVVTCLLPLTGRIGDLYGFKKIYLVGILLFVFGAVLSGISKSLDVLSYCRIIQGIGGAILFALTPAIISSFLPPELKGKAFGINYAFTAIGGVIGRAFSGFIIDNLGWSYIFLLTAVPGFFALSLAISYIPSVSVKRLNNKIDWLGSFIAFAGLFLFMYALNNGQQQGWLNPFIISSLIAGASIIIIFIYRELKIDTPLFNLKYFKNKLFSYPLISFAIIYILTNGMVFAFPFYFQWVKNFSKPETGLLLTIPSIMQILSGYISGYLSDRRSIRIICTTGMIMTAVSYLLFIMLGADTSYTFIIISLAVFGIAIGTFIPANTNRITSYAAIHEKGSVSALMITIIRIGSALGVCFFAVILSMYVPQINPAATNVPPGTVEAGFKAIFTFGMIVALAGIYFTLKSGEKKNP